MKYTKPSYTNEVVNTSDIILTSIAVPGGESGVTLTETGDDTARVSTSVKNILGSIYK